MHVLELSLKLPSKRAPRHRMLGCLGNDDPAHWTECLEMTLGIFANQVCAHCPLQLPCGLELPESLRVFKDNTCEKV